MDKENVNNTEYIDKEDMNNEQESVSHDTLSEDNQNELIYQYPIEEMRGSYEDYFKQEYRKNKKTLYILAAMFFGALVSFMVYTSATSSRFSSIFLIIGIIILVLLSMTAKGITSKRSLHFLSINADEKCLTLTYYTQAKSYKREYIIPYNRILSCRFVNKDFTKIQFVLKNTKCNYYNLNDEIERTDSTAFMVFNLNPLSYEQGYFLYVADKYFDIKGYQLTNKIIKKYGNMEEYFEYLQEGE